MKHEHYTHLAAEIRQPCQTIISSQQQEIDRMVNLRSRYWPAFSTG